MIQFEIESESVEPLLVEITSDEDPSGTDPAFQLTSLDTTSPTGSWEDGEWDTAWNATSQRITAQTPTIGKTGTATLELTEGVRYILWIKWGSVIKRAAYVSTS